jgi:hypothetical protein
MLKMLAKMIRPEKLLGIIAFAILMHSSQMLKARIPIGAWEIGEFFPAVAARIVGGAGTCLVGLGA